MVVRMNPYEDLLSESGLFLKEKPELVGKDDVLVIAPKYNSEGRNDATGAFHAGAVAFCREQNVSLNRIKYFDNKARKRDQAEEFVSWVEAAQPKVLACFCHGYTHGIQPGIRSPGHNSFLALESKLWDRMVEGLCEWVSDGFTAPVVALYACSTGDDPDGDPDSAPGSGDGSFADLLRDSMCARWAYNCRVMAHTTAGHSWHNPRVKLFDGGGEKDGAVGAELVAVYGTKAEKKLDKLLETGWAFRFPFMTHTAIRAVLEG